MADGQLNWKGGGNRGIASPAMPVPRQRGVQRIAMAVSFYPRGGSAQVVKYLCRELQDAGIDVHLFTGSLGEPGEPTHAPTFYDGLDVTPLDFTGARDAFEAGADPMAVDPPMHPSFEDRGGVPDRVLTSLSPVEGARQVAAWRSLFASPVLDGVEVVHVHHLTAQQLALAAARPRLPLISHIHGTELLLLEWIAETRSDDGGGAALRHADYWRDVILDVARRSERLVAMSSRERDRAEAVLGLRSERFTVMPNGVDIDLFRPRPELTSDRLDRWRRWLVEDPRGWTEGGDPGSIRYTDDDLADLRADEEAGRARIVLYVGRFTQVKQLPMLIRAFAAAQRHCANRPHLVVWGGFPGEWEGTHPHTLAKNIGLRHVYFAGWRGHDELPFGLVCSDLLAAPSREEGFGQVYLEAMATGLPVIAPNNGGPLDFVNTDPAAPEGWLVDADDEAALADALVAAIDDDAERRARGERGVATVKRSYSWATIASRWIDLYGLVARSATHG